MKQGKHVMWPAFCALFVGLALLYGCHPKPAGKGYIYVDYPEVFTRERLVQHRIEELNWLRGKLAGYQPTTQGYREYQQFSGLVAKLGATFDPTGGGVAAAQAQAARDSLARQQELGGIQHSIDTLKLQKQLEELKKPGAEVEQPPTITPVQAPETAPETELPGLPEEFEAGKRPGYPTPSGITETKAQLTSIERLRDELAYRSAVRAVMHENELDDTHDLLGYTLYTLKFDISVMPEKDNDRYGRVQLTLDQPAGVSLSGHNPPAPQSQPEIMPVDDYKRWLKSVDQDLAQDALDMQLRFTHDCLPVADVLRVIPYLPQAKRLLDKPESESETLLRAYTELECELAECGKATPPEAVKALELPPKLTLENLTQFRTDVQDRIRRLRDLQEQTRTPGGAEGAQERKPSDLPEKWLKRYETMDREAQRLLLFKRTRLALENIAEPEIQPGRKVSFPAFPKIEREQSDQIYRAALAIMVREEYNTALSDFAQFNDVDEFIVLGDYYFTPGVKLDCAGNRNQLVAELKKNEAKLKPYIYSVEPKEYAQNISDVAAKENLLSLAAALSAALPKAAGLDAKASVNYIRQSQERLQAILREPLVVGYTDGRERFGWLLGPKFTISSKGRNVEFKHTAVQHSVQATVAVPAWWPELNLTGRYFWGQAMHGGPLFSNLDGHVATVRLPCDFSALTTLLFTQRRPSDRRPPSITPPDGDILLHAGRREQIAILGRDLWRSPEVFIGSQPADEISIFPDMKGLLATFNKVVMPGRYGEANPRVDLTVVTSNGPAALSNAVVILPAAEKAPPRLTVKPKQTFVITGDPLRLSVPKELIPRHAYAVSLRIRPTRTRDWWDVPGAADFSFYETEVLVTSIITHDKMQLLADFMEKEQTPCVELEVDLRLHMSTTGPAFSIPDGGISDTIIYFRSRNDSQSRLSESKRTLVVQPTPATVQSNIVIEISPYNLFAKAHPGLDNALRSQFTLLTDRTPLRVKYDPAGPDSKANENEVTFTASVKGNKCTLEIRTSGVKDTNTQAEEINRWVKSIADLPEGSHQKDVLVEIEYSEDRTIGVRDKLTVKKSVQ